MTAGPSPAGPVRAVTAEPDVTACQMCGHPRIPADHEAHGRLLRESRAARNAAKPGPSPWTPQAGERARREAARRLAPLPDGTRDPLADRAGPERQAS